MTDAISRIAALSSATDPASLDQLKELLAGLAPSDANLKALEAIVGGAAPKAAEMIGALITMMKQELRAGTLKKRPLTWHPSRPASGYPPRPRPARWE
jgi:hypothetical protein